MNRFFRVIAVAAAFLVAGVASAQDVKFGHVNMQLLIELMPERDSAMVQLTAYRESLEETLVGMQTEYQTKINEFQSKSSTWTPVVLDSKQKEIQAIESRIMEFQQNAQQEFGAMQQRLFAPVMNKAQDALGKIGKREGFIYIFDTNSGTIPYIDQNRSIDVLPMAKAELGIPAEKVAPTPIQ